MTTTGESARDRQAPVRELRDALDAAKQGVMPTFDTDSLLRMLHLDTDSPDGQTLMERITDGQINFGMLRPVSAFMRQTEELIDLTNEYAANPAQEAIAQGLGAVVTRQVIREGDVCPGARAMAFASTREDIIPAEVKMELAGGFGDPRIQALMALLLEEPAMDGAMFVNVSQQVVLPPQQSSGWCKNVC